MRDTPASRRRRPFFFMSAPENNITRYIIIAIALLGLAAMFWQISDVFIIGFGGIVFATILRSISAPLARKTGWSKKLSLVVTVFGLLIITGALVWLFGAQAARQFAELQERLPEGVSKFQKWLEQSEMGRSVVATLKKALGEGGTFSNVGLAAGAALAGLGNLLLIIFVGIYFAVDPALYRDGALRLLPPPRRPQVKRALNDAGDSLQKWLVAQLIVMVIVGVVTGVSLALLGVPLSLSLGVLAGLFEFVPVVGPIFSAVPGLLLAFSHGPETTLYALAVYIGVQQLESNVLTPLIQRWAVELPPVVALLSIVASGLLFGVMGVVFATPLAVAIMAMVKHLYVEDTLENGDAEPPVALATRRRRAGDEPMKT